MNDDWPERLHAAIERRRRKRFAWGENDCLSFALGVLHETTGVSVPIGAKWTEPRDKYKAAKLLRDMALSDLMTALLGAPIPVSRAQRGDVVSVRVGRRRALAVCIGAEAVGPGKARLATVPMSFADAAWRKTGSAPCQC